MWIRKTTFIQKGLQDYMKQVDMQCEDKTSNLVLKRNQSRLESADVSVEFPDSITKIPQKVPSQFLSKVMKPSDETFKLLLKNGAKTKAKTTQKVSNGFKLANMSPA